MPADRDQKFAQLRQRAEQILGKDRPNTDELSEIIHELEVHQVELEMQHAQLQRTTDELERTNHIYTDLFDFAPVGYVITDQNGIIQQANLTFAAMVGLDRDTILNQPFTQLVAVDFKDMYHLHMRSAWRTEEQQTVDVKLRHSDDTEIFVCFNSEVYDGNTLCRTAITNVTPMKEAEAALKQVLQQERELNHITTRLIEVISHELRTPLASILSSMELLEQYSDRLKPDRKQMRYDTIRDAVWQLTHIVEDVVLAHQSMDDIQQLKLETFEVVTFFEDLIQSMSRFWHKQDIHFTTNCPPGTETVTWDPDLVKRIGVNLIHNALKYSDDDVHVELTCHADTITITVQDHGIGIPPEDQSHVFELFYRGHNTVSSTGSGVGLGVVALVVQAHNGSVTFDTSDKGTTFYIRLPRLVS